ncbi:MAG: TadE/TadG family type IV pilus assembly protein [Pseudomonadota bacterium]
MIRSFRDMLTRRQSGSAAVELAIVLPLLFILMTVPLFFARYFWHYTVAHKAAMDAARYLSTVSVREMRSASLSATAGQIANGIAEEAIADLSPGRDAPTIEVLCGPSKLCIGYNALAMPETIKVRVSLNMFDNVFGVVNTGFYGWPIVAEAEVRYVGR